MSAKTGIQWTEATWNPWWGCTRVSAGCQNCYAETFAHRFGVDWGKGKTRRRASIKVLDDPFRWDHASAKSGKRTKVFLGSMMDWADESVPLEWVADMWETVRTCKNLDWQMLTKRPERIRELLPSDWGEGWPHVWMGTTVENQEMANKRVPELLRVPAKIHFLSVEPMLGPVNLNNVDCTSETDPGFDALSVGPDDEGPLQTTIDWVICGGESGHGARPMHPDWARSLRDQCQAAGVPFFFKQWGEFVEGRGRDEQFCFMNPPKPTLQRYNREDVVPAVIVHRAGKEKSGRLLDDREWNEFPV